MEYNVSGVEGAGAGTGGGVVSGSTLALLLERSWTLLYSQVAKGKRRCTGMGKITNTQLSAIVWEFFPENEKVLLLLKCPCYLKSLERDSGHSEWGPGKGTTWGLLSSAG